MNFYMPVKFISGPGCVFGNAEEFMFLGRSCLIVTGSSGARLCGALDDVTSALDRLRIYWKVFDCVCENPSVRLCSEAGKLADLEEVDFIIGIGGGSALDAAKACAVFASNPDLSENGFYSRYWPSDPKPIVLVGTTAGTGSEVTNVSVLTDSSGKKHSIHDDRLYATVAFGDPRYTMSLPHKTTLSTGIDVLAHCAESYFSKKANAVSEAYSISGISLLYPSLLKICIGSNLDLSDRTNLYNASILGGLAISVTGTVFPHSLGYYFTENFGIPHGIASALFFPELLEHAKSADLERYSSFLSRLGRSEQELISICEMCTGEPDITMYEDEISSALSRWENNGSVNNTVGTVTTDYLEHIISQKFLFYC